MSKRFEDMTTELFRDLYEVLDDPQATLDKEPEPEVKEPEPTKEFAVMYCGSSGNRVFTTSDLPEGRRALRVAASVIKMLVEKKFDSEEKVRALDFVQRCIANASA
jgi:hypothetical protein